MDLKTAKCVATEIISALAPYAERIEIAGSVRRGKPDGIKDVEIVAVSNRTHLVFGGAPNPLALLRHVDGLLVSGRLMKREVNGHGAWGDKYRRIGWINGRELAVSLDLFVTTQDAFGWIYLLRTGPEEFGHALVTPQRNGGAMPAGMKAEHGQLWRDGEPLYTPDETAVFASFGLPFIPPEQRSGAALKAVMAVGKSAS